MCIELGMLTSLHSADLPPPPKTEPPALQGARERRMHHFSLPEQSSFSFLYFSAIIKNNSLINLLRFQLH